MFESLFNKVAGLQPCRFTEKRLQHRCFPVNIANFLRTFILKNIYERSLLNCVPYLLKTCSRANVSYVLTCFMCLRAHVPTCFACLRALRALRAQVLTCLACLRAHVPTCLACLRANVPCVLMCSCVNMPSSITLIHI